MATPVLVTAPVDPVVGLDDLKMYLRIDHDDEDDLITALQTSAVAWLDGWSGILGRAIMPQQWRQDFNGAGPHLLALPDVTEATATVDGAPVAITTEPTCAGVAVTAEGVNGPLRVTYDCAMPDHRLPAAQVLVKMMVSHWYHSREPAAAASMTQVPMTADALVAALRWRLL